MRKYTLVIAAVALAAAIIATGQLLRKAPSARQKEPSVHPIGSGGTTGARVKPARIAKAPAKPRTSAPVRRPALPPFPRTVAQVLDSFKAISAARYQRQCVAKNITWPPARLTLLAFKRERQLEVWAANATGAYRRIGKHTILGASGGPGPKRKQGDLQVPEGMYRLTELNPNSIAHLSVRVDYPNAMDIANSAVGREEMGGDIYVHGHWVSFGCLAIGDPAIEELFPLIAQVPAGNRDIVIAPFDFRRAPRAPYQREERWVHDMYNRIKKYLAGFPAG